MILKTHEKKKKSDINDTVNSKKIIINPSYEVGNSLDVNNNFYNNTRYNIEIGNRYVKNLSTGSYFWQNSPVSDFVKTYI